MWGGAALFKRQPRRAGAVRRGRRAGAMGCGAAFGRWRGKTSVVPVESNRTHNASATSLVVGETLQLFDFDPEQPCGRGHFSVVYRTKTDKKTCVKVIDKSIRYAERTFKREVRVLSAVKHKNIIALRDHWEDEKHFYLALEYCAGGSLYDFLLHTKSRLPEVTAARIAFGIGEGLAALHECGIAHRDVKPENILMTSNGTPKLGDMGLAARTGKGREACVGTKHYCSPEMLTGGMHDLRTDVWSLGVLVYILLVGYHPFDPYGSSDKVQVAEAICSGIVSFDDPLWLGVSELAKDLVRGLLAPLQQRLSLELALQHPWFVCCGFKHERSRGSSDEKSPEKVQRARHQSDDEAVENWSRRQLHHENPRRMSSLMDDEDETYDDNLISNEEAKSELRTPRGLKKLNLNILDRRHSSENEEGVQVMRRVALRGSRGSAGKRPGALADEDT